MVLKGYQKRIVNVHKKKLLICRSLCTLVGKIMLLYLV